MHNDPLTAKQKAAVRRLIAAKSDREIARLLRQTYRLLNLHQRPRSNISHPKRWMDYELQLLGRMRDEELAQFLRRSSGAVAARREALGIPIFAPQRIRWSRREIELLGKRPDPVVARILGRTRYAVQLKRHSLGIAQSWEDRRAWTREEERLLGKMRDQEVAKRLGRSVSSVRTHRLDHTNVRFIKTPRKWAATELRLLGRLPDAEVGRKNRTIPGVSAKQTNTTGRTTLRLAPIAVFSKARGVWLAAGERLGFGRFQNPVSHSHSPAPCPGFSDPHSQSRW